MLCQAMKYENWLCCIAEYDSSYIIKIKHVILCWYMAILFIK